MFFKTKNKTMSDHLVEDSYIQYNGSGWTKYCSGTVKSIIVAYSQKYQL